MGKRKDGEEEGMEWGRRKGMGGKDEWYGVGRRIWVEWGEGGGEEEFEIQRCLVQVHRTNGVPGPSNGHTSRIPIQYYGL